MLWLQSVYVDADFRGQGVFRQLLDHSLEIASAAGDVVNVRLYVEHDNTAAMASYQKLGFVSAGYEVMEMPLPFH